MAYQVTARKWRPQAFDEVVFQEHVSRTLRNSITEGRISHAYLFAGPRGVGKTTMARIFSRAVNCEQGPTEHPCGVCPNCQEIRGGGSFDVIEIDGASNNSVEDVRQLRENVNFMPVKCRYKIYIIDEVHMLSTSAFNALLKTLEEPPAHVLFVFATTEYHKIPETILSRCQKFFFKKIPVEPIVEHLRRIIDAEGFRISARALYPVARAAGGSMRDAQSLLDQVISFSRAGEGPEAEIGEDDALAILGILPVESYVRMLLCVGDLDPRAAMDEVERIVTLGVDIPRFVAGFLDLVRAARLLRNGITVQELLGLSAAEITEISTAAERFDDEELGSLFAIITTLQEGLRFAVNDRTHLEMALLDMIMVKRSPSLAALIQKLEGQPAPVSSPPSGGTARPVPQSGPAVGGASRPTAEPASNMALSSGVVPSAAPIPAAALPDAVPGGASSSGPLSFDKAWPSFMNSIREGRQYLHFILKNATAALEESSLHLRFPGGADHTYYRKILTEENIRFIRETVGGLLGRPIQVIVGEEAAPPAGEPASDRGMGDASFAPPPEAEMMRNPASEDYKKNNPAVERLKNAFHGEIIKKKGES